MKHAIATLFAWDGTRRRPAHPRRTPKEYGLPYRDISFHSAHEDRVALSGWLIPADRPAGLVILCHGHGSTRTDMLAKALMLRRHHFTTLLFDFRARGMSGGDRCTLGLNETQDLLGAVRFARDDADTAGLRIGLLGESMGGAAAICAAAGTPEVCAVVAEAAYASLPMAVRTRLGLLFGPFAGPIMEACTAIGIADHGLDMTTMSPIDSIGKIAPRPVLLIVDGFDPTCPRRESDALYAAAGEPRERWIVRGAPHTWAFQAARTEYERRVSGFFSRSLALEAGEVIPAREAP